MQISVMGEGHTHCVNVSSVHEFTQRFERGNTIKMHSRIMFDFYPGLPHVLTYCMAGEFGRN